MKLYQHILLFGMSINKLIFHCFMIPIIILIGIVECLIYVITIGKINIKVVNFVSDFVINTLKKMLKIDFHIIFKKYKFV